MEAIQNLQRLFRNLIDASATAADSVAAAAAPAPLRPPPRDAARRPAPPRPGRTPPVGGVLDRVVRDDPLPHQLLQLHDLLARQDPRGLRRLAGRRLLHDRQLLVAA